MATDACRVDGDTEKTGFGSTRRFLLGRGALKRLRGVSALRVRQRWEGSIPLIVASPSPAPEAVKIGAPGAQRGQTSLEGLRAGDTRFCRCRTIVECGSRWEDGARALAYNRLELWKCEGRDRLDPSKAVAAKPCVHGPVTGRKVTELGLRPISDRLR